MNFRLFALMASVVLLVGCGKSADYYSNHLDEAQKRIAQCAPDEMGSGECKAAAEGMQKALMKKAQEMMKQKQ